MSIISLHIYSTWSNDKKRQLGLLFILHVGVFGRHRVARLPLSLAKLVLDKDAFERYPWGTQAFKVLVQSIKAASFCGLTYALNGPVHVLLVWAYEYIPALRDFAKRKEDEVIPLIRWESRRLQVSMEDVLANEIHKYKTIRVEKHMVVKPHDEIYPPGCGMMDPKLDSMIRDIINGCLDESFWGVENEKESANKNMQQSVVPPKQKRQQSKVPPTNKKRRKVVTSEECMEEVEVNIPVESTKQAVVESTEQAVVDTTATNITAAEDKILNTDHTAIILKLLGELSTKIDVVHKKNTEVYHALKTDMVTELLGFKDEVVGRFSSMETKMCGVETQLDGFDRKMSALESQIGGVETKMIGVETQIGGVGTKMTDVETQIGGYQTKMVEMGSRICLDEEEKTKAPELGDQADNQDKKNDEGAESTSPSWKTSTQATSDPDCPMTCIVRKSPVRTELVESSRNLESEEEVLLIPLADLDEGEAEPEDKTSADESWLVPPPGSEQTPTPIQRPHRRIQLPASQVVM